MNWKIKIRTEFCSIELGYDLPRIPVKGENIKFFVGETMVNRKVEDVTFDLIDREILIDVY